MRLSLFILGIFFTASAQPQLNTKGWAIPSMTNAFLCQHTSLVAQDLR